ncbi:ABC transporter substrate-binding protein [Leifsonia sp. ALI-44-B]|uniref:ABC transporter substrate-binding protein n=1 Tax=Leifsonia sp. ALI-44-B TaxID=1933776 RepID=UPI00117A3B8C|nr:ABC transporter substrate-binding protein [Leifsonia sp. ALI-44-B]
MKKTPHALVIGGLVALALTACSSGGTGTTAQKDVDLSDVDYSGTVSVITRYAGAYEGFFQQMKADFEAEHPDVTIELQQESDQGYKDKIKTLTASQSLPDVYFSWAGNYAEQFYDNGVVQDLTSVIGSGTEWGDTLAPSAVGAFTKDGKTYGIPFGLDAKFMVYNEKMFADAGATVPTDLDSLLETCSTLSAAGLTPMSFGNVDGWPALHFITQLNSYNVPAKTLADDYKPDTATFENPGYVDSLDQFSEIVDQCTTTGASANGSDYYSQRDAFGAGASAMFYVENLEFGATVPEGSQAEQDGWNIFKLPVPADAAGDTGALTGAPDGFLVNPKAENLPLAVEFMRFVTDKKNAETLTTMLNIPSPVVGSLTESNSTPQLRESIDQLQDASSLSIWLDTVTVPDVADAYLSGVEGLIAGDKTPEQVMDAVKAASEQAKG